MNSRLFLAFTFIALLFLPAKGQAALVVDSVVSTPTMLTLLATWTDPDATGTIISAAGAPNWKVDLTTFSVGGGFGVDVNVVQHLVPGFGPQLTLTYLLVSPGIGGGIKTATAAHPPGPAFDKLVVTLTPTIAGLESSLSVVATHTVPEPSSWALGLLGSAILLVVRRRSARQGR